MAYLLNFAIKVLETSLKLKQRLNKVNVPTRMQGIYSEDSTVLHSLPVRAGAAPVYDALYENLQVMLMGDKTPEQAMKDSQKASEAALK